MTSIFLLNKAPHISAVISSLSFVLRSAPASSNIFITSGFILLAAAPISAVLPSLSLALTFAPAFNAFAICSAEPALHNLIKSSSLIAPSAGSASAATQRTTVKALQNFLNIKFRLLLINKFNNLIVKV